MNSERTSIPSLRLRSVAAHLFVPGLFAAMAVTTLTGGYLWYSYRESTHMHNATTINNDIVVAVFDLDQLAYDYITNGHERAHTQWLLRNTRLHALLDGREMIARNEMEWLNEEHQHTEALFTRLSSIISDPNRAVGQALTHEEKRRRDWLADQLLIHTRKLVTQAETLHRLFLNRGERILKRNTLVIATSLGTLIIILVGTYVQFLRSQTQLAAKTRDLERSNAELERFAFVCSHDLQEPLRMVTSFLDLLVLRYHDRLDERGHHFVKMAQTGTARMQELVKGILSFSRIEIDGTTHHSLINSADAVRSALSNLHHRIDLAKATITVGALPHVRADLHQLEQLFQNLIGNALKYHSEQPLRIQISAQRQDPGWLFCVSDNGIGIDPEHHMRIFKLFTRLHSRDQIEGSGIGLSICRRIVEIHGGTIWVESSPGVGSSFKFTLMDKPTHVSADKPTP